MQRRILIVEDSPTQAARLRFLLEDEGYQVDVAAHGQEGLRIVQTTPPDLIISDIMMPMMDGYAFCQAVKSSASTSQVPFVLLTDQKTPLAIIKGLEHGADNFITKPYEDDYLAERVRRIFEHLDHRREEHLDMEVKVRVGSRQLVISADKQQIIELLFSTFDEVSSLNDQLVKAKRMVEDYAQTLEEEVRKRTEELRTANETLSALVRSSPMAIVVIDTDGQVLFWNPAAEQIFGWSAKEVIGHVLPTVPEDKLEEHRALREQVIRQGGFKNLEVNRRRKDGKLIDISLSTAPLRDAKGDIRSFMGIMDDITERKTLEAQFRQVQKIEAVGQLTGGIAHDFNNLLTVINGYSEMLLQTLPAGDPARDNVAQIKEGGERAAALTRQLLAFSRRQILEPKVLDLNAVVTNLDKMLQRLIGEDIDLVPVLAPRLGRVKADPGQIEQVIMNLVVNARDAMPQGGKLTIETASVELDDIYVRKHVGAKPGPHVMLAVSDTGCGMDAETQRRIFEPFFTTKEKGKGTGLGLATVYGIVKQSGGSIWAYSEVGRGTTFKVYLPRVEKKPDTVLPDVVRAASLKGSETILLVEDDAPLRKLTLSLLRQGGYHVLEASDREQALQICGQHDGPVHLMLTDVVMPGMSGQEVAQRLAVTRPDMKVLFMSGYTDDTIVRHGVLGEDVAFLQKPFTADGLLRKVRKVLDAKRDESL